MKEFSRIFGAIWCQIILLKMDGNDTRKLELIMDDFKVELLRCKK